MMVMPAWGMLWNMFKPGGWLLGPKRDYLLFGFGLAVQLLTVWIVIEAVMIFRKARGVLAQVPDVGP